MCSSVGSFALDGQVTATTSKRAAWFKRPCELRYASAAYVITLLFAIIDRVGRMAGAGRGAGLHFDEDDGAAVDGDDVEFG
jgi:hypothetical protein